MRLALMVLHILMHELPSHSENLYKYIEDGVSRYSRERPTSSGKVLCGTPQLIIEKS